jgi:hypothetical protein
MARGITREIEEQQQEHAESSRPASAPVGDRNPFDTTSIRQPTPRRASAMKQQTPRGKVHLPDVTGLTSAVESPAKMGSEYYPYRASDGPRESEGLLYYYPSLFFPLLTMFFSASPKDFECCPVTVASLRTREQYIETKGPRTRIRT